MQYLGKDKCSRLGTVLKQLKSLMKGLSGKIKKKSYNFSELLPFENLDLTSQFCKCNISKSIEAKDSKPVLADKK